MKSTRKIVLLMMGFLLLSSATWAQLPSSYRCSIQNDVLVTPRIYEFDVYLQNLDLVVDFELASFAAAIRVNTLIRNGGTITASAVAGNSQLLAVQVPTFLFYEEAEDYIEIGSKPLPGKGNGTIISCSSSGTRVIRYRLTNSVDFGQSSPDLIFNFSPTIDVTIVKAYDQTTSADVDITASSNHTTATMINPVLNKPVTLFGVTGDDQYCIDDIDGEPVGLDGSETGVSYRLFKDGTAQGSLIPGTGNALAFGDFLKGVYTVTGYRTGTYLTNDMNGSATLIENPMPTAVISGTTTICIESEATLSVTLTGTAPWSITYTDGTEFEIYPVPNDGHFKVIFKAQKITDFDILIYNSLGSKVLELKRANEMDRIERDVDISSHGPGIYYVVFRSDEKQFYKRVVVNE